MSELPARLSPGQHLSAHWLNRLLDFLRSRELRSGPGVRLTRTPSGTTVSAEPANPPRGADAAEIVVPAVVTGYTGGVYTVDVYANGLTYLPTRENVEVTLTEVAQLSALPVGAVILVHNVGAPLVLMDEDYEG